jgi:hypothetical protein
MQFFLDVMNGALDAGKGRLAEISATALESIGQLFAGLIEGMAGFMEFQAGRRQPSRRQTR